MYKHILFFLSALCFNHSLKAQQSKEIRVNQTLKDISIQQTEINSFSFQLKKDIYYSIIVEQNGIDVKISLKEKNGKLISEKDSPNGKFGPENLDYSPDSNSTITLLVSPLADTENSKEGLYNITVKQVPKSLKHFNYKHLLEDFEILKNGFIETKIGLWYNSYAEFDSLCNVQKSKIKDKMTALEFYQLIAPVVAFTKEGHSTVRNSDETASYFKQNARYFPFIVKILLNIRNYSQSCYISNYQPVE
jgi:hypothetical protein